MKREIYIILLIALLLVSCATGTASLPEAQTAAQTATLSATKEHQIIALADSSTPVPPLEMIISRWTFASPDGQWIAEVSQAYPKENTGGQMYHTSLIVRSTDGKKQWNILDEWAELGVGLTTPQVVRWGKDGRSLYYTNALLAGPCPGPFRPGYGLLKVDLDSGTVTEVVPFLISSHIVLSPDETLAAYLGKGGLVLQDLTSMQERVIYLESNKKNPTSKIVWSPDGKFLAITQVFGACYRVEDAEYTSILLVNVDALTVETVVLEDKRNLVVEEWVNPDQIALKDMQGNEWMLNTKSGEITQP
jgi:hypothetical protein